MLNALKARKSLASAPASEASHAGEGGASRPSKAKWGALDYSKWDKMAAELSDSEDEGKQAQVVSLSRANMSVFVPPHMHMKPVHEQRQ